MASWFKLASRRDVDGNTTGFYDSTTWEDLARFSPAVLDEDFIGPGHSSIPSNGSPATGYPWVQRTVKSAGTPTVAVLANSSGGIVQCALDATSEAQQAVLYANDSLNWDGSKSLVYETRVALSVLPSAAGDEAHWGMHSAWTSGGPDADSFYMDFQVTGNGAVNYRSKDGVNTFSNASGVTLTAGVFHIFRIDATDPTNVIYSIDGTTVSANNMSFAATGTNAVLQPISSVYKPSGTGVASLQVDMIQIGMNRS